jgi:hypothetical protein
MTIPFLPSTLSSIPRSLAHPLLFDAATGTIVVGGASIVVPSKASNCASEWIELPARAVRQHS